MQKRETTANQPGVGSEQIVSKYEWLKSNVHLQDTMRNTKKQTDVFANQARQVSIRDTSSLTLFDFQSDQDVCEACLEEVNSMQEEIDFLRALLRKNKITIPDGPYGQKQHG